MNIGFQRTANQQIFNETFHSAKDLVSYMGAMQGQDYAMAKWAIGCRLKAATSMQIEEAFNKGEIIRAHLMRPTWHFVSADDLYWMLQLTTPQIKTAVKHRFIHWGFDEKILHQAFDVIQKSLAGGCYKTRDELMIELQQAGVNTDEGRAYHLMLWAELEMVVCSGSLKGKAQTYALLHERIPVKLQLSWDEALAKLALKYFTAHAPATLQDFVWWSGLKITDARKGLELVKNNLCREKINDIDYWFPNNYKQPDVITSVAHFLPAFDEFVISYANRRDVLDKELGHRAISSNGVFKPIVELNGQVIGIWKRTLKKDSVLVEPQFFRPLLASEKEPVERAALLYAAFEEKKLLLKMK